MVTRRGGQGTSCASFLAIQCWSPTVPVCCPSPEPGTHWRTVPVQPLLCIGRYEGTDIFLGRQETTRRLLALAIAMVTEPQYVFGAATVGCTWSSKSSQQMRPTVDAPGPGKRKKAKKPLSGRVCLLTTGVLISVRPAT